MTRENQKLKQSLNLINFKLDDLEQYGRRENIRMHNVAEIDCDDVIISRTKSSRFQYRDSADYTFFY